MKQILCLLIPLFFVGASLRAQQENDSHLLNLRTIGSSGPAVRAVRDFIRQEGDGKEEKWYKTDEGFLAEFEQGGRKGRYFYNKKGVWCYSILGFGESGLPEDIRRLVRSTYFEFGIGWVEQVSGTQGVAYVVHIENAKAWKEIVVRDGEMTEWKAYNK
jgi:hypothetical protein